MLPIVKNLCELAGDTLTVKNYSRLTPLTVCAKSLKSYKNIEKGDCVVGFGRKGLYDTKGTIERNNPGLKCCVIYGGLPPDARKQQANIIYLPFLCTFTYAYLYYIGKAGSLSLTYMHVEK
jgi:ATP-dependent RNA helicase SUPV3L1/SUV3